MDVAGPGLGQVAAAAARTLATAEAMLERLCSEEFGGRRVGTQGHDRAQAWLLDQLAATGYSTRLLKFEAADAQVLDLFAVPALAVLDRGSAQNFTHRVEFTESPRSAAAAEPRIGLARASLHDVSV